jgi:ribosome-associated protein
LTNAWIFRRRILGTELPADFRFAISFRQPWRRSSVNDSFTGSDNITAQDLAKTCAELAADKKAEEIVILDLRSISTFTDFFVICSGTSEPHLKAIASEIEERLKKDHDLRAGSVDGFPASQWIVLDYLQVIIHIFRREKRDYYSLEDLWGDAPRLSWETVEGKD